MGSKHKTSKNKEFLYASLEICCLELSEHLIFNLNELDIFPLGRMASIFVGLIAKQVVTDQLIIFYSIVQVNYIYLGVETTFRKYELGTAV